MNSYEEYLEKIVELKEKEIELYKEFIENELGHRIREEIFREKKFDKNGVRMVRFKAITIPQSQYIIKLDE